MMEAVSERHKLGLGFCGLSWKWRQSAAMEELDTGFEDIWLATLSPAGKA